MRESPWRDAGDLREQVRARVQSVPEHEQRRLRRRSRLRLEGADGTHPPLALRLDVVEASGSRPAAVRLSDRDRLAIDAELDGPAERLAARRRR